MTRIQRKCTKGWRMPPNTTYVGRPGKWGNPFIVGRDDDGTWVVWSELPKDLDYGEHRIVVEAGCDDREEAARKAVALFREALLIGDLGFWCSDVQRELRGKNLACWCPIGTTCHADVLLEIANREEP